MQFWQRHGTRVSAGIAAIAVTTLAACTSGGSDDGSSSSGKAAPGGSSGSAEPSTSQAAEQATITASAVGGITRANPAKPIVVKADKGSLESVKLVNPAGKVVAGKLADDGSQWQTTEPLAYSRSYTLVAVAKNDDGVATTKRERVTTLRPNNMTQPYFSTIGGGNMVNGATYGVGMIIGVHFDEPIPNKKTAEKVLQVKTSTGVTGAWYWLDDQNAHWRPRNYYKPGTKVTVTAKDYGVNFGNGLYGQADKSTAFTVGSKRVAIADASTHHVKVYFDDKLVRNMPTSMGRGGYVQGTDGPIGLWTPPGNYTVIGHENPAIMSSDSYGLPTNSADGYGRLVVPWSTKISTDGIYLHQLDETVYAQGSENLSHGCLNLNQTNAEWYFEHSRDGDVVKVVNSGGPSLEVWRGGDWTLSWAEWLKGSAS